jgi:hypothetical protein
MKAWIKAALAVPLALAACTEPPPPVPQVYRWAKPGASYDDYMSDRFDCASQVISLGMYKACMGARGWRQDPAGFEARPSDTFPAR